MYPPISSQDPKVVVPQLVAQVQELTEGGVGREAAIGTVLRNRYNGRFARHIGQVRRQLVLTDKKPAAATPSPVKRAFLPSQYSGLALDERDARAPVIR